MKSAYLHSLLWLVVATTFIISCNTQEKDQIQPKSAQNSQTRARVSNILYEQVPPVFNAYRSASGLHAEDFVVPVEETWNIEKLIFYGQEIPSEESAIGTYNVFIYADDGGKPGQLLYTSSNHTAEIVGSYDLSINGYQLDISDISLNEGRYWYAIQPANGLTFINLALLSPQYGYNFHYLQRGEWIMGMSLRYTGLAFTLVGTVEKVTTIDDVLTAFNTYLSNGTIIGAGKGNSAKNRPKTFLNMLNNAKALIEANDIAGACIQLTDAQKRIHTGGILRPDHFITGSNAGTLYDLITKLKTDLGCN
jgi:hypothetical protein